VRVVQGRLKLAIVCATLVAGCAGSPSSSATIKSCNGNPAPGTITAHYTYEGTDGGGAQPTDFRNVRADLWAVPSDGHQQRIVSGVALDEGGCVRFAGLAPGMYVIGGCDGCGPMDGCHWYGDRSPRLAEGGNLTIAIVMHWSCP